MPLTTVGREIFLNAIAKGLADAQLASLWFGIGDGDAPFDDLQMDLQGENKIRAPMLAGWPKAMGDSVQFMADFDAGTGGFVIREYALFTAATSGDMIYRNPTGDLGTLNPLAVNRPSLTFMLHLSGA